MCSTLAGLEPAISGVGNRRLIHWPQGHYQYSTNIYVLLISKDFNVLPRTRVQSLANAMLVTNSLTH